MVLLNEYPIVKGNYPNHESIFYDLCHKMTTTNKLLLIYENDGDLFDLAMAKKYIDDNTMKSHNSSTILIMPFCPYGQSDRTMGENMFSFKYFAQFINDLNFDTVYICDPHSSVMEGALNRVCVQFPVPSSLNFADYDLLFYPDNGAAKKYSEIYPYPYRYGNKKRNLDTGEIICYEVIADRDEIKNKKILIRDDLCMGGRTFKEATKALKEMGAKQVDLFVTHLMPQAIDFYKCHADFGITNFYTIDTLNIVSEKL